MATIELDAADAARQGLAEAPLSWGRIVWRRFRRSRLAVLGAVVLLVLVGMSVLAPWIAPYSPEKFDLFSINAPPGPQHLFGTDEIGRDNLSRLIHGGRVSFGLAVVVVFGYVALGSVVGATAGFWGGWVDGALMRMADAVNSFPFLLLALTLAAILGSSTQNLALTLILVSWPVPARLVRGEFLSLRERDFVEAARATGAPAWRIAFRHMLPNAMAALIVQATLAVAFIILAEAALSYLGFGVPPEVPTWGNMMTEASNITALRYKPWQWVPPGICIFLSVLSINFVGDALRDALDPRLKH